MKKIFYTTVILSGLLMVFSCNQDPIFYKISTETEPKKPHIPGAPTKMVVFERPSGTPIMFVASGGLHWYRKNGIAAGASGWDSAGYNIPQPGGKVIDLAVTRKYLYALSISSSGATTTLRRIGHTGNTWEVISPGSSRFNSIQTIFADPDTNRLFAGAMDIKSVTYPSNYIDYGILSLDDSMSVAEEVTLPANVKNSELLSGAAFLTDTYYLCTRGNDDKQIQTGGVFKVTESDLSANNPATLLNESVLRLRSDEDYKVKPNRLFMGMIKLDDPDAIIVIERDGGTFFEVQSSGFRRIKYKNYNDIVKTDRYSTGALALWDEYSYDGNGVLTHGTSKMLVAGIQGGLYSTTTSSSYTHGYAEFYYPPSRSDGWLEFDRRPDGATKPDLTVGHLTDRYSATIGKHPINYMFQVPRDIDNDSIFFASTQTAGLWSYRFREPDGPQWNAETEK